MNKIYSYLAIGALVASMTISSCKKKEDETTTTDPVAETCDTKTYPTSTGTATITVKNFSSNTISTAAGDLLSFAVEVTKGTNRPQKLRVYESDCKNDKGTQVKFDGQLKVASDGTIDLRNTDSQVRNFNYTVPTGYPTIYLTIETDESGGAYTYHQVTLNVSGSGVISEWSNITLGSNSSTNPSRMSSGTGLAYKSCDAAGNLDYIDITFANAKSSPYKAYISSNKARTSAPLSTTGFELSTTATSCGDDGDLSTSGGKDCYFKTVTGVDFDAATDTELSALSIANTDNQYTEVTAAGQIIAFLNPDGKKGLIKVVSATDLGSTSGDIVVSVKVQR